MTAFHKIRKSLGVNYENLAANLLYRPFQLVTIYNRPAAFFTRLFCLEPIVVMPPSEAQLDAQDFKGVKPIDNQDSIIVQRVVAQFYFSAMELIVTTPFTSACH